MITGKNYIGNELKASGTNKFKSFNPSLNACNTWEFIESTTAEVEFSAEKAWDAFKCYRKTTPAERASFLEAIAFEIELLGDELLDVYMLESGLPKERAGAEKARTLLQLRSFSSFLRENEPLFSVNNGVHQFLNKKLLPLGPVVVFGASNFPLAYSTAGGDTASAFAAGCPVIVKSHPMHPATGELVASAIVKAVVSTGMPDGVFSNLNCADHRVGMQLVQHEKVKAVGFTGSLKGGRALFDLANGRPEPIPVFAEMGSTNPIVISEKSLKEKADFWAEKIADSMLQSAGQFCTSPGLIFAVDSPELSSFSQKLAEIIGNSSGDVMLGQSIKQNFLNQKTKLIQQAAMTVLTNNRTKEILYSEPAILLTDGQSFKRNKTLHEEVFGSFAIIVKCKDQIELNEVIENLEGQLTGTIILEDEELPRFTETIETLQYRVGRLIFNGVPTGVEVSQQMNHGGPYPASTDSRYTAVGADAIYRWLRPISFQNVPIKLMKL